MLKRRNACCVTKCWLGIFTPNTKCRCRPGILLTGEWVEPIQEPGFKAPRYELRGLCSRLKAGKGCDVRVAGLLTASDATYGLKNMPWHGMYGKALICKLIGLMINL